MLEDALGSKESGDEHSDEDVQVRQSGSINQYNEESLPLLAGASGASQDISQEGTSWYFSVFIVVNAALGAGLLNFPAAYHQAGGIAVALIVQAVLLLFIVGSLLFLAYCSDLNKGATYQDVVLYMCGKWGQISCSALIALYCFGTCITFFIIIADQLDIVFSYAYGNTFCHVWYMNKKFTLTSSCILLILPLCFPKKIDFLKHVSAVGVLAIFYLVVVLVVEYYSGQNFDKGPIRTKPEEWTDVFIVVPVICFGYQCHVSAIPIYSCFKKRKLSEFTKTVVCSILVCVLAYSVAAVFGYLSFGGLVESDVLLSYPSSNKPALVGRIMTAAKTYTTYPILLFCGRAAADDLWMKLTSKSDNPVYERRRRITFTLIWFFTSLLLAVVIPDIGDVINMLGSLAALFIFVYPGVCLMQRVFRRDPQWIRLKYKLFILVSVTYIVLGVFIFGVVVVQSIQGSIHPGHRKLPPICKP